MSHIKEAIKPATDAEWAKFTDFLEDPEVDEEKSKVSSSSTDAKVEPLQVEEKKGENKDTISTEDRAKATHEQDMEQAAYGARLASLLMKRQALLRKKRTAQEISNNVSDNSSKQYVGNKKDVETGTNVDVVSPSLAFDYGKTSIPEMNLFKRSRQAIAETTQVDEIDDLDWRCSS